MDADRFGPPLDVRPLFQGERAELVGVLRSLGPGDWQRPTACPGWTVHDLATHLLGDDLGRISRARDTYIGVELGRGESLLAFLDRINDEWVVAARRLSPTVLCDLLPISGQWVHGYWSSVDMGALGEPVSWAGRGRAPVWLDAARDFTEYWTHQQQIREAAHRPLLDDARYQGPVLDTFLRALPFTLVDVEARPGTVVELRVDGVGGGAWAVTRTDDVWVFTPPGEQSPTTTIVLDADTTWRLCTRGISPAAARAKAVIVGDFELAEAALQIVSAIV